MHYPFGVSNEFHYTTPFKRYKIKLHKIVSRIMEATTYSCLPDVSLRAPSGITKKLLFQPGGVKARLHSKETGFGERLFGSNNFCDE